MQILSVLNDVLTGALGPFGPLIAVGGLGVMLILLTIPLMLRQKQDPLEKLKQENQRSSTSVGTKTSLRAGVQNKKLDRYATFLEPQDAKQLSQIRLKLMQAGYRHRDAVRYFHFAQFALGVGLLILGVIYYVLVKSGTETSTQETLMYILGPAGIGYMMPKYWVTKRQQKRQEEIQDGFPDSLDMMLVCIEAGQSMDQSIIRVASEMRASYPALADEFEIVALQIKAGRDKPSVLGEMAERCGVQDISSFVTVLVQSQTFGTSIGEALRVYAGEMRDKRVMRAEEKANKLPTKMTLATMMLTVPPLLIILVGPSVLGIMDLLAMSK
ncbi:Type II secretion system (T2SS), protein F [Roseovarius sp. EC-HK134]|jgi:tight adherence protein C|uniref:Type II secretion system (T2SS), protein F n=1 Tax=Roseovarius mucosus TaxID=215743 RepID=A0A1V0RM80_9RHOB|nr:MULTISPECIES: type II secretion system F family protein [Roseovarius]MBS4009820.1 type II secretion system F family protein [Roseovarius sp.]ARE82867.1 type II secretion system (T2SS), protein F [Roseovarius mucosus]AWZ19039.1 Type II/IV secretion system protein TadC, associated with Flp pilus assembly [Roseovarius sp. AK1035]EDM33211.1 type II/IV secretion system protein, TadC subfamily [Roseovarius sp. TM1035]MBW4973419.1 type II secretion system F family protein [Roseovarius mucosus]|tara:strand:- start:163 stop:1143 length:981 start_codon:yes stop_codon:yes gene_type:complete